MSMSNTFENDFLKLIFNNVAIPNIGDANGIQPSAAAGNIYIRLHTADPGESGTGDTNEANYTGYSPVAVPRTTGGFTVTGNQVVNAATIQFGECTAGTNVITHASFCVGSGSGATILWSGALTSARTVSSGITPLFNPGALGGTVD